MSFIKLSHILHNISRFVLFFKVSHAFVCTAGYNNLEVAEYLLEHGADVNAQDKGGLIPLHNAASYGVSPCSIKTNETLTLVIFFCSFHYHSSELKLSLMPLPRSMWT